MRSVKIEVPGIPAQQGSKTGFVVNGRAVLVESNKKLKPWRGHCQDLAKEAMNGQPPFTGPCEVHVTFSYPWLKKHIDPKTFRVKIAWPWKTTAPDLDKLQRAVGDSLIGIVLRDDSIIVRWFATKQFDHTAGCSIWVRELHDGS